MKKAKKYPKEIWAENRIGSNGIHCLDYMTDDKRSVKYIRADFAENYHKEKFHKVSYMLGYADAKEGKERVNQKLKP